MMDINTNVTGISVCWNTLELVERSFGSIRIFHPEMPVFIVDGSDKSNRCYGFTDSLQNECTTVHHTNYNIGHGKGMHFGLRNIKTPFALLFDSDIEMLHSPVQAMLDMMEDDTYGVGYMEHVGEDGFDYGEHLIHKKQKPVRYMHPYFCLIQVKEYFKYKPFIHHGAPCIPAMLDIHRKNLSSKVLKEFPDLGHTKGQGLSWSACSGKYILHDVSRFGGTGRMRVEAKLPHIDGQWERVVV